MKSKRDVSCVILFVVIDLVSLCFIFFTGKRFVSFFTRKQYNSSSGRVHCLLKMFSGSFTPTVTKVHNMYKQFMLLVMPEN